MEMSLNLYSKCTTCGGGRVFTVKCLPFSGSPAPPLPSVMSPSRVAASRLAQQGSDLIVPAGILCTHWLDKALLATSETKLIHSVS